MCPPPLTAVSELMLFAWKNNNRLKISIGLNNYLQIAYSAFQCLPVLYQVRHFRYRYRYWNRYRLSTSIGSIGISGVGGIVLTLTTSYTYYKIQYKF